MSSTVLSKFCSELILEVADELLHDGVNLLVVESFLLILEDEVDSVALLTLWQVLALVNVEEFNLLKQFLL